MMMSLKNLSVPSFLISMLLLMLSIDDNTWAQQPHLQFTKSSIIAIKDIFIFPIFQRNWMLQTQSSSPNYARAVDCGATMEKRKKYLFS